MGFGKAFWSLLSARPVHVVQCGPVSQKLLILPFSMRFGKAFSSKLSKLSVFHEFPGFSGFCQKFRVHRDWIGFWKLNVEKIVVFDL